MRSRPVASTFGENNNASNNNSNNNTTATTFVSNSSVSPVTSTSKRMSGSVTSNPTAMESGHLDAAASFYSGHSSNSRPRMSVRRRQHPRSASSWIMRRGLPHQNILTIAALLLLVGGFVLFNVQYVSKRKSLLGQLKQQHGNVRTREQWVSPSSQAFNDKGVATKAKNLIVVAGHSVTTSGHLEDADQDESDWFLLPYQKHAGLPQAISQHITAGLQAAHLDPESLLIFSGGETRAASGPDTEGVSYFRVADARDMWPKNSNVRARTLTEEFARDSFENLMFSVCRFHEVTNRYPTKITVVSFTFKERRFSSMHAKSIRWNPDHFFYLGVDPSPSTGFDLDKASKGEMENAAKPFETDPYGCHTPVLREKRQQRNPFYRTPPYELTCPDMKALLQYCGPDLIPAEQTPWGSDSGSGK